MKRHCAWMLVCLSWLVSAPAGAVAQAVVDAVQAPAWLERNGRAEPLEPGMAVGASDRLRTGEGSRVYLKLADGSTVKLGENGVLTVERPGSRDAGVFSAALDVAKGAFRFTTDRLRKLTRRDVAIRVATVTAGVRGTDLWGKTEPARDFICLLEGRITVSARDGETRELTEPLSLYVVPRGGRPLEVERAAPEKVREWAAETEIAPGQGGARVGGKWKVVLGEADDPTEALALFDRARAAGFAAAIRVRTADAGFRYAVLLRNLPSRAEAAALARRAGPQLGVSARASL